MKANKTYLVYDNPLPQLKSRQAIFPSLAEIAPGKLAAVFAIGEAFESVDLTTYIAFSEDGGKTWSEPRDTGIRGQASSVLALGGEKLLVLHSMRRHTDKPGILACVVDMSDGKWNVIEKEVVWQPASALVKDAKMADIFAFLKFGQPSAVKLSDGRVMMIHWYMENGQYNVGVTEIEL